MVVQTSHERDFLQNLVYYVARAYRVRDYGIWERGDKGNHGLPERNASSIGLVKAALEALEGLDLYGPHGSGQCHLHIPHDAIVRLRRALSGLLLVLGLSQWALLGWFGVLPALLIPWYLGRRLGGHSGDSYGACVEWSLSWTLLLLAALASWACLLYTSPSPRDRQKSRMPSSA